MLLGWQIGGAILTPEKAQQQIDKAMTFDDQKTRRFLWTSSEPELETMAKVLGLPNRMSYRPEDRNKLRNAVIDEVIRRKPKMPTEAEIETALDEEDDIRRRREFPYFT